MDKKYYDLQPFNWPAAMKKNSARRLKNGWFDSSSLLPASSLTKGAG
jgi:hypothetical protein